jgi:hypothetical protein
MHSVKHTTSVYKKENVKNSFLKQFEHYKYTYVVPHAVQLVYT